MPILFEQAKNITLPGTSLFQQSYLGNYAVSTTCRALWQLLKELIVDIYKMVTIVLVVGVEVYTVGDILTTFCHIQSICPVALTMGQL